MIIAENWSNEAQIISPEAREPFFATTNMTLQTPRTNERCKHYKRQAFVGTIIRKVNHRNNLRQCLK